MNANANDVSRESARTSRHEYTIALITGSVALLGVLVGSAVSGYFSMKTQSMLGEQQKSLYARQQASSERLEMQKTLSEYIDLIGDYYALLASNPIKEADLDTFARRSLIQATKIMVLVSLDLGRKSFEMKRDVHK